MRILYLSLVNILKQNCRKINILYFVVHFKFKDAKIYRIQSIRSNIQWIKLSLNSICLIALIKILICMSIHNQAFLTLYLEDIFFLISTHRIFSHQSCGKTCDHPTYLINSKMGSLYNRIRSPFVVIRYSFAKYRILNKIHASIVSIRNIPCKTVDRSFLV